MFAMRFAPHCSSPLHSRYYQNHRKYATSRSDYQLRGHPLNRDPNCEPYEGDLDTEKVFAPCGLIANSMFNGEFVCKFLFKFVCKLVFEFNLSVSFYCNQCMQRPTRLNLSRANLPEDDRSVHIK